MLYIQAQFSLNIDLIVKICLLKLIIQMLELLGIDRMFKLSVVSKRNAFHYKYYLSTFLVWFLVTDKVLHF